MLEHNNKIDAAYLRDNCSTGWHEINVLDQVDSTNSWLKKKTNSPVVCLAETQTQGRGRNGNSWLSPDAQNIYLSFNWFFEIQPKHLPLLSLWIGIVVAETIESIGVQGHGIKWPNDLYCMNKKLGGILIETSSASSQVIVGIGINTNVTTLEDIDQPWTSLSEIMGGCVDRNKLLVKLLNALYVSMQSFDELSVNDLLPGWERWDLIRGKSISFLQNGQVSHGRAQGIDDSGHLRVELDSGQIKAFNTSISQVRWE